MSLIREGVIKIRVYKNANDLILCFNGFLVLYKNIKIFNSLIYNILYDFMSLATQAFEDGHYLLITIHCIYSMLKQLY